ncbi:MAG TPA: ATP-binding protein [Alphaproteobacteria bacterium]|jgi:two-component system osmolarity sensor histidine kinase EnvZ|nr:ATP-binding protein [Alphaproteobacteria bacterium]
MSSDRTERRRNRTGIGARIKRFLPRTLEGRTFLILVVPVLIAQMITVYIFFERHFSTLSVELSRAVAGDVALLIEGTEKSPSRRGQIYAGAAKTLDLSVEFEPDAQLSSTVEKHWNPLIEPILETALQERIGPRLFTIGAYGDDNWVEIRVQLPDGVLDVRSPQRRLFSYTAFVFIAWVVGASLFFTSIAVIFMRNQVRPIRRLALAAENFGKGRDTTRLKPAGALEVRQAATAFLTMRDRIRRQIAQRTEMLAGVSHDLRTPLTRMKLQLALLGEGEETEELRADVGEMETMIEAYLAFARGEGGEVPQRTDMAQLLREVIDGQPGRDRVTLQTAEPMTLTVRPSTMKRCLANLIGNALRYGTNVRVDAGWRERTLTVVIDDDGPGIPPDNREDVFRPFFRLEESRNISTGGVGLGLSIALDIAHGHGGEIALEDSPMGGLRVVLTLPG